MNITFSGILPSISFYIYNSETGENLNEKIMKKERIEELANQIKNDHFISLPQLTKQQIEYLNQQSEVSIVNRDNLYTQMMLSYPGLNKRFPELSKQVDDDYPSNIYFIVKNENYTLQLILFVQDRTWYKGPLSLNIMCNVQESITEVNNLIQTIYKSPEYIEYNTLHQEYLNLIEYIDQIDMVINNNEYGEMKIKSDRIKEIFYRDYFKLNQTFDHFKLLKINKKTVKLLDNEDGEIFLSEKENVINVMIDEFMNAINRKILIEDLL